jgi:hypothetical protein
MGSVLTREQIDTRLKRYYESKYGEYGKDIWFEIPASNVWMFVRDERLITLRCHVVSGEVAESAAPYEI